MRTSRTVKALCAASIVGVVVVATLAENHHVEAQGVSSNTAPSPQPTAAVAVQALPQDLPSCDREITATGEEITKLNAAAHELEIESQGITPRKEALVARARRQIKVMYHLSQGQTVAFRSGPEASVQHAMQMQHVRRAVKNTLDELDGVDQRAQALGKERELNTRQITLAQQRKSELEGLRQKLQVVRVVAPQPSRLAMGAAGDASGWPTMFDAPSPSVTVYGGAAPPMGMGSTSFSQSLGRLLLPIAGRSEVRRANRPGASGPGLEVIAAWGSPVRAVFSGHVSFADRYGAFGKIVILDHGEHYYTVSANLGEITVRAGEDVSAGTVIGTIGDDGHGPQLYLEIRQNTEALDPAPWFGL